ncbi:MAG: PAS domain-containing protein [Taibaiella sp.]|nr:PAS domain-containing protein [Taibaiella sp.]
MKEVDDLNDLRGNNRVDLALKFIYLPMYAAFVKQWHLRAFVKEQITLSYELKLPMLKYLAHIKADELEAMSMVSVGAFFEAAEQNMLADYIATSMSRWCDNELVILKRDEISAEDILLATHIRKRAMFHFLPLFTSDIAVAMGIVNELEIYTHYADNAAADIYITILKVQIREQAHFAASIAHTTPGLNYVFNIDKCEVNYVNENCTAFLGLNEAELRGRNNSIISEFVHPDDLASVRGCLEKCFTALDGDIITCEIRLKNKDSQYVWMRNYCSVFKRDANGAPFQIVGIALDIDEEFKIALQLKESEQHLLKAQALAHMGNWYLDLKTGVFTLSDELFKIHEIAPAPSALGNEVTKDLIHPDDMDLVNSELGRLMKTYEPCDFNYRIVVKSGAVKYLNALGEAYFDNTGKAIAILGTLHDITEKQLLIVQLQQKEALYKQAQSISRIGNWVWEHEKGTLEWSDELYHIYELKPGTVLNSEEIQQFNHYDDREMVAAKTRHAIEHKVPFDFYYRIILKSGKVKILHAIGDTDLKVSLTSYRFFGTLQDVTEQKEAERKLKEYKDFIQKITDVTPSIIATYNIHTGAYSFINEGIEKILGFKAESVLKEGVAFLAKLIHPEDIDEIMLANTKVIAQAKAAGKGAPDDIVEFKYRVLNAGGQYRWLHTYGIIFERNENGMVESVLNVSVDITEQETVQQTLYQKNIQLQQSNASLEEYAYVASHDLKEPLRKIATFTDRILTAEIGHLNDNTLHYLGKINESSQRMQKIITDLLSVSIISGNKAFEKCSLQVLLEEALHPLDQKLDESNMVLEVTELPLARVVPTQFRQLFQNLASNSLKFVRPGVVPHIKISWCYHTSKAVEQYNLVKAEKYLQIDFSDNGIGFDNQYAQKIFTIFQRLHGRAEYEGTGIGLAICKKIVENHSGVIFATGYPNLYAIFSIIIPL